MGKGYVKVRGSQREVSAWEAAAGLNDLTRQAWALLALDTAAELAGPGHRLKKPALQAPSASEPRTNATDIEVMLRATSEQLEGWQRSADAACMSRHAWMRQVLLVAAGLSHLPAQLHRL